MNNAYQTNIKVDYGFEIDELHPIRTYSETIQNAKCADYHAHPRAQIISCDRGIMKVVTEKHIWIVNPLQSVWLASYEAHQVYFPNNVSVVSVFIDPSKLGNLPKESFAFESSIFIKSLLTKIISFSNPDRLTPQQNRIFEVLLDEISTLKASMSFLPTSRDKRIKKVTDALMNDISSEKTMEYYASLSCVSPRTLSRLFVKELGMSFGDWKMRLKLLEAIKQLGENKTVKDIAYELGYKNASSFIAIFKKHFGKTPTNYVIE
ncbi:helix-turn-helix transcriptional regulator [Echinicola marina]|uniref:AraC family transcriptional regulator n=1 Tax=Echinicola marina TaxID=2859768 RepID=UPI001CF6689D|nr:helix-turn-helix transcriptional regulator [Echinicola marina]UCS92725.1 helix-turn-helix transcriptional regulator [Echinicola marina]